MHAYDNSDSRGDNLEMKAKPHLGHATRLKAVKSTGGASTGGLGAERVNLDEIVRKNGLESKADFANGYSNHGGVDPHFKLRNKSVSQIGSNIGADSSDLKQQATRLTVGNIHPVSHYSQKFNNNSSPV